MSATASTSASSVYRRLVAGASLAAAFGITALYIADAFAASDRFGPSPAPPDAPSGSRVDPRGAD